MISKSSTVVKTNWFYIQRNQQQLLKPIVFTRKKINGVGTCSKSIFTSTPKPFQTEIPDLRSSPREKKSSTIYQASKPAKPGKPGKPARLARPGQARPGRVGWPIS